MINPPELRHNPCQEWENTNVSHRQRQDRGDRMECA